MLSPEVIISKLKIQQPWKYDLADTFVVVINLVGKVTPN